MKYSNKHIILVIIITVIILLYLIINIYHLLGIYVYFTYNMEGVILYIDEIADNIIRSNAVNEISLLQDTILYSQYGKIFTSSIASISSILLLIYSTRYQVNKVKALMYVILVCVSVHLLNDLLCVIFTDYYSNHLYNINASLTDSQMSDIIDSVLVIDNTGHLKLIKNSDCEFSYRKSIFKMQKFIILGATLKLTKVDSKEIPLEKIRHYVSSKKDNVSLSKFR